MMDKPMKTYGMEQPHNKNCRKQTHQNTNRQQTHTRKLPGTPPERCADSWISFY